MEGSSSLRISQTWKKWQTFIENLVMPRCLCLPSRRRQPSGMTSTSFQSSSGRLVPMSLTAERLWYEATRRSSDEIYKQCTIVKKYLYYKLKNLKINSLEKIQIFKICVSDAWIRIQSDQWIRIQEGKTTRKIRKKFRIFMFWSAKCLFWGLKASPVVWTPLLKPGDKWIEIFDQKNIKYFSRCKFFTSFVIKTLDPDYIRIRIGIQPKMLGPDPDSMNPDPKHCYVLLPSISTGVLRSKPNFTHALRNRKTYETETYFILKTCNKECQTFQLSIPLENFELHEQRFLQVDSCLIRLWKKYL